MTRLSPHVLKNIFFAVALSAICSSEYALADSIIRIIGDTPTKSQTDTSISVKTKPAPSTPEEGGSIRIIGNKTDKTPLNQNTQDEQLKAATKVDEQRRVSEKTEQDIEAARQAAIVKEQEQLLARQAEETRVAAEKEKAEADALLQDSIRKEQEQLAARQTEELREAAKKTEQEKLAAEAVRQAAIQKELEQLENRKAEELRNAANQAEQERISALKADEERLAAARRAMLEQSGSAISSDTKPSISTPQANSPSILNIGNDIFVNKVPTPGTPSTQTPASIWELFQLAKTIDPALGRTEARVTISKAETDMQFSSLLPHIDSSAGVKQISQTLNDYGTSNGKSDYLSLNYNISARMTLLNIPTIYALSAAAAALGIEQAGVVAASQNLIVKFADSYFALLKAQTDKQIALGEINRLRQVLDQSQAFLKAGTGDIISVYEAQSRLDSAVADLTKSESSLRLAEQKLSNQVGKPITDVVNYLPQQPSGPEPDNIDWWVTTMEKEQPSVRQAREALTQTLEQRKAAKAEYLPTLQASGGYDVNRGTAALPTAEVKQWFVGATLSLPLYSGGETSAKVRRAVASEEERRHMFDETMDQQRENVKQAFFNLRYNISLIKALEQKKASAEIQLAAVKKGRKIGTRNAIDVLNAEQTYSIALRDQRYALYDNIIRVIQLKSAAGILAESDISGLSEMVAPAPDNELNMIISLVSR
jgi:outer membrane protein